MSYDAVITEQIVSLIFREVICLRADQRHGFVEWLAAHCAIAGGVASHNDLKRHLTDWFEGLPGEKVIQELLLCLTEICWWRRKSAEEVCRMNSGSRHAR